MNFAVIQLITAFFGSIGFALTFRVPRRHLLQGGIGGALCWGVYLMMEASYGGIFVSSATASAISMIYAATCAKFFRAPSQVFLAPSVIVLVPGRTLFLSMSSAVRYQWESAVSYAFTTARYAIAIAAGISLVVAAFQMWDRVKVIYLKKK